MIDLTTHYVLSITSSTIIGTAAIFLALTRIPREERWMKISRARWILFATFVILAVSGYFKVSDEDPELLSLTTLCVASYQALLFTYTASVLISPAGVSRIRFTTAFKVFLPVAFRVVWALAVVAYCIQLGIHTIMFRELSLVAKKHLENFYDENVDHYLRPVKALFYSAFSIKQTVWQFYGAGNLFFLLLHS